MKKHLGSTVALVFGSLVFFSGFNNPPDSLKYLIAGLIIILGALAYKSAKKRKLGIVKSSVFRIILEITFICIIIVAILFQKNLAYHIETEPVLNLIIPMWAIIAYLIAVSKKHSYKEETIRCDECGMERSINDFWDGSPICRDCSQRNAPTSNDNNETENIYTTLEHKAVSGNYILRHWRGELSLAVSFWVNLVFINIVNTLFEFWWADTSFIKQPQIASRIWLIYVLFTLVVLYPWQIIGLWRACKRHVTKTGKKLAARTAQVLVIFGFFATIGSINSSWQDYRELYDIGFTKDKYANYTLELTNDNTILLLKGGLGFGVSKDVSKLLNAHPNVNGIVLDSPGGRIYEGGELAELILANKLDTYSFEGCYSACTTAFIAGKNRYIGVGANLAFHQYYFSYKSLSKYVDIKKEQEVALELFRQQGVKKEFIDKLFKTRHDDLWYPSLNEMIDAGVVHSTANKSDFSPIQYELSSSDFDEVFQNMSAYSAIKKYEPEIYQEILVTLETQMKKGASVIEMQVYVGNYLVSILDNALPQSSDDAIIEFFKAIVHSLKELNQKEPIICLKYLHPDQYGAADMTEYLDDDQLYMDAINKVIIDAYEKSIPSVDSETAEKIIESLALKLGEDIEYLNPQGLQNSADYKRVCTTAIKFYELILAEDKIVAANTLRYMCSLIE